MLRDENTFFSFPYQTRGVERVWNTIRSNKALARRINTEAYLHAADTPRDVKIVWKSSLQRFARIARRTADADETVRARS